ncbi:hypothetical protein PI87_27135 [Ralstonia sp. A12]|uniref:GmrSD restriction endonuclease domain-containing protein n=1 Tax=Ralstonia sp. A12 TaxID=1217052 RepID=UPI00057563EE|nr:DUF262 domain-containing protein [Ralstonia sp. A12]KHK49008.1 hypothetical protein PI87_27135 [Ralstonia sp. A12]
MQNRKLSIRKIVSYLNNDESEGGGFWLPNIQRPFVWSPEQMTRLFDSIMREYPISTLLVWKTRESVKHRRFIDTYHRKIRLTDFYVPDNSRSKMMVLDGQQRLQSLYIGLKGSYEGKELYFDVTSGQHVAPEDIRYRFAFKDKATASWPWVCFKDIVFKNGKLDIQIAQELIAAAGVDLTEKELTSVQLNVARARQEFVNDDNITFQELDSIDNPEAYRVDDIVEIFIRANSGGTKLGKSDLLFSLLSSSWDEADGEMEALLSKLNQGGFAYDRDFVLKTCLTVLGKGARYEVGKFRDGQTKEEIVAEWPALSGAITAVHDLLVASTYIRSDKAMPSYLALIPLVYYRYHYPEKFAKNTQLPDYLLRVLVTGVFSGNPDTLIDKIVRDIQDRKDFALTEIYGVIREAGRSLEITPHVILEQHYGSREIHLFFSLWYRRFNYQPAYNGNTPSVDHIFPQSLLRTEKVLNPETGRRNLMKYPQSQRDQIANCMLLTTDENGAGGKSDIPPHEWFARGRFSSEASHREYLDLHLIPHDPKLWQLERFDAFVEARQALIREKFSYMLQKPEALVM